ncbi:MAG TPA: stage II sporulation protein M [Moraxellaceae bacterium]|nr:stage II sporulation protein M [Moraxellaceae bacterium]
MSPQEFIRRHEADWVALERAIVADASTEEALALPMLYRRACQQLAIARSRHYPPALVDRLNLLVVQAHHRLYETRQPMTGLVVRFLLRDFPELVRRHAGLFWLSALCFYGAFGAIAVAIWWHPSLVYSVMDASQVREFEQMYDPARRVIGYSRDDTSDFLMFGYYVQHNIGIGFQTFAGGMIAGVGSLLILFFNGISIGAVAGHLTRIGYTETFWSFVCGHGAFELTAIVLSGMAGLMLGRALIAPGNLRRADALRREARPAVQIIYGASLFLLIAAFLEAFWSSSTAIPPPVKYAVALLLWSGVIAYLLLAGRRMEPPRAPR